MEDRIRLSYFYGKEADQFSFYKIPKLLFTEEYFKKISVEAKVLYGLMLDRMSLSMKNQWMDDEGRAYIYYSLEDIMEALGCSNKKAISIKKEVPMNFQLLSDIQTYHLIAVLKKLILKIKKQKKKKKRIKKKIKKKKIEIKKFKKKKKKR